MSGIDWSWQDVRARKEAEREADEANRRSRGLAADLEAAKGNAQARAFTITALEQKVAFLEKRLADVEGQLRHYKSRDAGFLAEVRALVAEIKNCPHPEHHILLKPGRSNETVLEDRFDEAYDAKWEELGKA